MHLTLPAEIQRLIDDRVRSGRYQSAEQVVTAALANLDQQEQLMDLSTEELQTIYPGIREKIAHGCAQVQAGQFSDGEEFFAGLEGLDRGQS